MAEELMRTKVFVKGGQGQDMGGARPRTTKVRRRSVTLEASLRLTLKGGGLRSDEADEDSSDHLLLLEKYLDHILKAVRKETGVALFCR